MSVCACVRACVWSPRTRMWNVQKWVGRQVSGSQGRFLLLGKKFFMLLIFFSSVFYPILVKVSRRG